MDATLQFAPFCSSLDFGFWHTLTQKKLEEFRLSDDPQPIHGFYTNTDQAGLPSRLSLEYNAFDTKATIPQRSCFSPGTLLNKNTLEDFKSADKKALIENIGHQIWKDITSGAALADPSLLTRFLLLTFSDLKKYRYWYWFAFAALAPGEGVTAAKPKKITEEFSTDEVAGLQKSFDCLIQSGGQQHGFFVIKQTGAELQALPLSEWKNAVTDSKQLTVVFADPCTLEEHPGWPLRNLLALASVQWAKDVDRLRIVCYRDRQKEGIRSSSHSLVYEVPLKGCQDPSVVPKCVGWEKNERGKMGPRMVDLSGSMDPAKLAESAVDLNLKLMRWRLLPSLDLERVARTRCLLLGSGTLGCAVARGLLGWGVRKITLVDNGRVSYSNPVRQNLYVFEDCVGGGKPKAETAAESLRKIFPGVDTVGLSLSIPMPGHSIGDSESERERVRKDVEQLEKLIDEHDVIFLLMDTRESRWLPSVIGAAKGKLLMNAALGFDTFVVLRHGFRGPMPEQSEKDKQNASEASADVDAALSGQQIAGSALGCYFCNDVVAPGDSTRDRTLDQQCTVTRPGISMIASALVVELMVSVLQHPLRGHAPADSSAKDQHLVAPYSSPLGLVPHQIRGFLARFHTVLPPSVAFSKCTACSPTIINRYKEQGFEFLVNAFNSPTYLEDLTGLTQMHADTKEDEVWELDSDGEI